MRSQRGFLIGFGLLLAATQASAGSYHDHHGSQTTRRGAATISGSTYNRPRPDAWRPPTTRYAPTYRYDTYDHDYRPDGWYYDNPWRFERHTRDPRD